MNAQLQASPAARNAENAAADTKTAALAVDNLAFGYGRGNVWENVSFELRPGALALLVGPNGAGKSTLLRCLAGWSRPREGSVALCGVPLARASLAERSRMAFVSDVPSFYDDLTADEHFELIGRANRWDDERWDEVDRLLEAFGIARFGDQYPQSYSRGMREKLALALALATRPQALLLDEPTGPLDPASAAVLERELAGAQRAGCAVIMSCHHPLAALRPTCVLSLDLGGKLSVLPGSAAGEPGFWEAL